MQRVFRVPRVTNTMLLESPTHVLHELRVLLYLSPFFMPAPPFPDSHKQWLAKGGHLGNWGNAATLKHNAFIVYEIQLFNGVERVRRSQQGAMVVRQVTRCTLWCQCRWRVMPVWFRCASGNRPGVGCAFCACYALHVSRFWPSSGGQHPVFRVLHTLVRVKEERPDSPERRAEPERAPDTETAAEGKMTDGDIQEL